MCVYVCVTGVCRWCVPSALRPPHVLSREVRAVRPPLSSNCFSVLRFVLVPSLVLVVLSVYSFGWLIDFRLVVGR